MNGLAVRDDEHLQDEDVDKANQLSIRYFEPAPEDDLGTRE